MFRLLRQLRKSLMEQGKLGKYLLYAIGEIILLVIGVLIALQINNWNNRRIDDIKKCNFLKNLSDDIDEQIRIIDSQFKFELEVVQYSEALLDSFRENEKFIVDDNFSKRLSVLNNRFTFNVANATFEELLASGNTNLITNDELKSRILEYYKNLELTKTIIIKNNEYVDNHIAPKILEISTHYLPNLQINSFRKLIDKGLLSPGENAPFINKSKSYNIIERRLRVPDFEFKFLNDINYRYRIAAVHLAQMDKSRERTIEIKDLINEELGKCLK